VWRSSVLFAVLLCAVGASGCSSAGYLVHVSMGQLRYLRDREVLDAERLKGLSDRERRGLEMLRRAQRFGTSLGLAGTHSYRHVIDRDRDSAVRVVVASPRHRLQAVTWWFPIVGRVAYRGYFDASRARDFAAGLRARGLDTYTRPALLYSTLGYFDDPIPLSMLRWPDADLVDVALHELVHETSFVAGNTDYNEALASFIGMQGTLAFFQDDAARQAEARRIFADRLQFARLIAELSDELGALYEEIDTPEQAVEARTGVFRRYQRRVYPSLHWETRRHDGFVELELSNAYLVAQSTYGGLLPCFERQLAELGADLRAFIAAHLASPGVLDCEVSQSRATH
jgi:predicted aminopeptidase